MRRCWVNFQCQGVLLTWLTVGQGPIVLSEGAGGGCLDIFSLIYHSFLSPSLWETARYRLKYCLKGPLSPKQPTNHSHVPLNTNLQTVAVSITLPRVITLCSIYIPPSSRGWSGGAKVLCKLSVPGRPTNLDYSRARACCACSGCGWGMFGHFFSRLSFLFSFSLSGRRPDID